MPGGFATVAFTESHFPGAFGAGFLFLRAYALPRQYSPIYENVYVLFSLFSQKRMGESVKSSIVILCILHIIREIE